MAIKLIIFDLDGVLVDTKPHHCEALNRALMQEWGEKIEEEEHFKFYDGLSTRQKLALLSKKRNLPTVLHERVWALKQELTEEIVVEKIQQNQRLRCIFQKLKSDGLKIYVATNSIKATTCSVLNKLGLIDLIDFYLTNEDVNSPKPNPEIYLRCVIHSRLLPEEILIVEDSINGKDAATKSGCNLLPVDCPEDVDYESIAKVIRETQPRKNPPWVSDKLNVLIPMAGEGSRFSKAGYTFPKPLIEVFGKPMIQQIVENLNIKAHFIFLCQKEHYEKYNLGYLLNLVAPGCSIVQVEGMTAGAASTTLLAKDLINNNMQLLIANSDQVVEWNSSEFIYGMMGGKADAGILTFSSVHPKWSYAKLDEFGLVSEVREKQPISSLATVGIYWWSKGSDYVKFAERMIEKNKRVNGEFYVCPVFNEAIEDGLKVKTFHIDKMWGIGTPEDLNYFIANCEKDEIHIS